MDTSRKLLIEHLLENVPGLADDLATRPKQTLETLGASASDLQCSEAAHAAFERAQKAADRIAKANPKTLIEHIETANAIADEVFGKDKIVEKIPYGLRFVERVRPFPIDSPKGQRRAISAKIKLPKTPPVTATGSVTVTFGRFDHDHHVDF
jgi:hypothetical protein